MKVGGRTPRLAPDPNLIRMLAELLTETGLTEIEYALGEHRVRVARGAPPAPGSGIQEAGLAPATPAPAPAATVTASDPAAHPGAIKAPMVGVAYLAPEPGAAPFVGPGETVAQGQTVLIIEAMKVMNQIRAPRAGRVARILVADAEPVEYGTVLMLIE